MKAPKGATPDKAMELLNRLEFIMRNHAEWHPPKAGDWNWRTLAEEAKTLLLEAGYTEE